VLPAATNARRPSAAIATITGRVIAHGLQCESEEPLEKWQAIGITLASTCDRGVGDFG
jgi:hypothetical protein